MIYIVRVSVNCRIRLNLAKGICSQANKLEVRLGYGPACWVSLKPIKLSILATEE